MQLDYPVSPDIKSDRQDEKTDSWIIMFLQTFRQTDGWMDGELHRDIRMDYLDSPHIQTDRWIGRDRQKDR